MAVCAVSRPLFGTGGQADLICMHNWPHLTAKFVCWAVWGEEGGEEGGGGGAGAAQLFILQFLIQLWNMHVIFQRFG